MRLVYELPPKSYAPVHIRATRVERKLDYFATLCSHFADGAVLMRPIKGVYMQVNHQHLRQTLFSCNFFVFFTIRFGDVELGTDVLD